VTATQEKSKKISLKTKNKLLFRKEKSKLKKKRKLCLLDINFLEAPTKIGRFCLKNSKKTTIKLKK
jgi:hypothetical protein